MAEIKSRLIDFFMAHPYEEFYLRDLAKRLRISPFAIKKYADILVKEKLILDHRKANLRFFRANRDNLYFRQLKIACSIKDIQDSGLISYLIDNIPNLSSLVFFGSMAKGEDDSKSDIDILAIGKKLPVTSKNLQKYTEKLNKEINLIVFTWSDWKKQTKTNTAFYLDVLGSGVVLFGEKPIVR